MAYIRHTWVDNEPITTGKMNNIEKGVAVLKELSGDNSKYENKMNDKVDIININSSNDKYPSANAVYSMWRDKTKSTYYRNMQINTQPNKIKYLNGENIDLTGIVVKCIKYISSNYLLSDGSRYPRIDITSDFTIPVSELTIQPSKAYISGMDPEQTATLDYKIIWNVDENHTHEKLTTNGQVTISTFGAEKIVIYNDSNVRKEYSSGENINLAGLDIRAYDKNDEFVNNVSISSITLSSNIAYIEGVGEDYEDLTITISYEEPMYHKILSCDFSIKVCEEGWTICNVERLTTNDLSNYINENEENGSVWLRGDKVTNISGLYNYNNKNYIGKISFKNCSFINFSAFSGYSYLSFVSIPKCKKIAQGAFQNCEKLEYIYAPDCLEIDYSAFNGCKILNNIFASNCTVIWDYAFSNCGMSIVDFPKCQRIGDGAFTHCSNLISISFPECSYIETNAFSHCTQLLNINFPKCTSLGNDIFRYCSNLISAFFPEYSGGIHGFGDCYKLESISFPKVTKILNNAFDTCLNLTSVNFPECSYIGYSAFVRCTQLKEVYLSKCEIIESGAFANCDDLMSLYIYTSKVCSCINYSLRHPLANTPIGLRSGSGMIYVPASLVSSYQTAEFWSTLSSKITAIPT